MNGLFDNPDRNPFVGIKDILREALWITYCWLARPVLKAAAADLRAMALDRFDAYGSHDRRGAAIWDSACYLTEEFPR